MALSRAQAASTTTRLGVPRLSDLCINVVVKDLERYPAAAFGIIDEYQWDCILRLRHRRTKPLRGKGGIDGRGRLHPAVTDKFMLELEEVNPHLNQSKIADEYIWKDIVEYKFKKGGLSRPQGLLYPWPVLVKQLEDAGKVLSDCIRIVADSAESGVDDREKAMSATLIAIKNVSESPMDLNLLKISGIGKKVKKFLSKATRLDFLDEPYIYSSGKDIRKTPRTTLESTLQSWKDMAAESGVKMKNGEKNGRTKPAPTASILTAARKCDSWRSLYQTLKVHDEDRRSRQGEKMRERRRRLDTVRPKIVKVRPASSRQDKILGRSSFGSGFSPTQKTAPSGNSKIRQLRMEAKVTSTRRQPPPVAAARKQTSGFGAAVAFASVGKKVVGRRKTAPVTKSVTLAGGKRMAAPDAKSVGSANLQKRLKMLKRGQSSFRP